MLSHTAALSDNIEKFPYATFYFPQTIPNTFSSKRKPLPTTEERRPPASFPPPPLPARKRQPHRAQTALPRLAEKSFTSAHGSSDTAVAEPGLFSSRRAAR